MNCFQYFIYKLFSFLINHLASVADKLHNNCTHTYPNGKTAMSEGVFYNICKICGQSEMTDCGLKSYDKYFEIEDIDDI